MKLPKLKCNCCDGIYNSIDVHFTSACDNKCAHCVDLCYKGFGIAKPNISKIFKTIVDNSQGIDDVLFLGGEPCLYLRDLTRLITSLRHTTKLKIFVTTSVPKVCHDNEALFHELIRMVDGINLSVQHHDEKVADLIQSNKSTYDRKAIYQSLPYKEKIRVNLNIVKPYLHTKEDITACLRHYDAMGFNSIKLSEIQHGKDVYVSFAEVFGIKMPSPYAHGCQTYLDMENILPGFKTPVLLKRSCFLCEDSLKASFADGVKMLALAFTPIRNNYAVVYERGQLTKGWV